MGPNGKVGDGRTKSVYSSMMEYSGIRIDEINLLLTIIIWNECGILAIQLQEDLQLTFVSEHNKQIMREQTLFWGVYWAQWGPKNIGEADDSKKRPRLKMLTRISTTIVRIKTRRERYPIINHNSAQIKSRGWLIWGCTINEENLRWMRYCFQTSGLINRYNKKKKLDKPPRDGLLSGCGCVKR